MAEDLERSQPKNTQKSLASMKNSFCLEQETYLIIKPKKVTEKLNSFR